MKRPTEFYKGYEEEPEENDSPSPEEETVNTKKSKYPVLKFLLLLTVPFAICTATVIWAVSDFFTVPSPSLNILIVVPVVVGFICSGVTVKYVINLHKNTPLYFHHIILFTIFSLTCGAACLFKDKIISLIPVCVSIILFIISAVKCTKFEKKVFFPAMLTTLPIVIVHLIYILLFVTQIAFQAEYFYICLRGKPQTAEWKTHYAQHSEMKADEYVPDDMTGCTIIKSKAHFDSYLETLSPEVFDLLTGMLADSETTYNDRFFEQNDLIVYTIIYFGYPRIETDKVVLSGNNLYLVENLCYNQHTAYSQLIYDEMCFRFLSVPKSYHLHELEDYYHVNFFSNDVMEIN